MILIVIRVVECRKGDIESAVKFLELYVEVAEGIESKETVAKAYCSAGIMFNFLVINNYTCTCTCSYDVVYVHYISIHSVITKRLSSTFPKVIARVRL